MGQTLFGIVTLVILLVIGAELIRNPESFLTKLGRHATDKHLRATRLIGAGFLIAFLMTLVQWFRSLH